MIVIATRAFSISFGSIWKDIRIDEREVFWVRGVSLLLSVSPQAAEKGVARSQQG